MTPDRARIIEGPLARPRLRRPLDLFRALVALGICGLIVLIAYLASGTASGLNQDVTALIDQLPHLIALLVNAIAGIGTFLLPVAVLIFLLARRSGRLVLDALLALVLGWALLTLAGALIEGYGSRQLILALAGSLDPATSAATAPTLGALVAFVAVSRVIGRRGWTILAWLVIGSQFAVMFLNGGTTIAALAVSTSFGWALGALLRYALGTPTTRPSGEQVAAVLARCGYPVTTLVSTEATRVGRRYQATMADGRLLGVLVLDRDFEGAGLVTAVWQWLRVRDDQLKGAFSLRRELDRAALMNYASQAAGAPVPRLLLASEVGPDSALMLYERLDAAPFSTLDGELTDEDLENAWRAMASLHAREVSHRALTGRNLLRTPDGTVWLVGGSGGAVASGDVARRIDTADLLCCLALLTDADRAVATGRRVLGDEGIVRALPVLQRIALAHANRVALRRNRAVLVRLRDLLLEMLPDGQPQQIDLRRIRPRTIIMIVLGSIAGYFLLSQLADVDLVTLITTASWGWLALALVISLLIYLGAAWSLSGFVPERLSLWRTILAQMASAFATLVSPPTLGTVAINVRFLQKSGLHPALAAASVGVSQVLAFVFHIVLIVVFALAAGIQTNEKFNPPAWAIWVVVAIVVIVFGLLLVPQVRRFALGRVRPLLREVGPRLITVLQRPLKLAEGIGGILLLNLACIGVLIACVQAFGGHLNLAAIAVVYLAGATLGQAAPTPGGLGGVEAAMSAGLTAAGLDAGLAVSSVLLFRLVTFWLPTIPGYFAFTWLQRKGSL